MKFILVMLMLLTGIGALSNVERFHYFTDHGPLIIPPGSRAP